MSDREGLNFHLPLNRVIIGRGTLYTGGRWFRHRGPIIRRSHLKQEELTPEEERMRARELADAFESVAKEHPQLA